uniref:Uncharacterized protein n=1 Tax=viral metagenome TaxID=1070528 RepID=A0A6C0HPM0_9ZZZZ
MSKRKQIETSSRCPNGSRRNKKTGICESVLNKRVSLRGSTRVPQYTVPSIRANIQSGEPSRCPNGSRRNKKTGLCEPNVRARAASTNAPIIRQSIIRNSPFRVPYNSAEISPVTRRSPLYASASNPLYASASNPLYASASNPLYASASNPLYASGSNPLYASASNPLYASGSNPLYASGSNPLYASASNPLYASASNPPSPIYRAASPSDFTRYVEKMDKLRQSRLVDLSPSSPFAQMQNNPSLTRRDLIEFSPNPENLIQFSPDLPSLKKVTPKQMSLPSKGSRFPLSQYPLPNSARMQGIKMSHKYKKTEKNPFSYLKRFPTNPYYSPRIAQLWKSPTSSASSSSFHSLENSPSEVFLTPESDVYLSPERSPIILRNSGLSNKLKRKKSDESISSHSLPANKDKYSRKRKNTRSMSRSARNFLPENEQRTLRKMSARYPSKSLGKSMKSRSPSKSPSPKRVTPASPFYELYPKYSPRKVKARKSYDSPLLAEIIANKKQMKEFTRKLKYNKEITKARRVVSNSTRKKTPVQSQGWASYIWSKVPKLRDK